GMLLQNRTDSASMGGLARIIEEAGLEHVTVTMIEYDAFHASDAFSEDLDLFRLSLWDLFMHKILPAMVERYPACPADASEMDPEQLALLVNDASPESFEKILGHLKDILSIKMKHAGVEPDDMFLARLGDFIGRLSPKLRIHFLETVSVSFQGDDQKIEALLCQIPVSVVEDIREFTNNNGTILPTYVLDIMEKLVGCSVKDKDLPDPEVRDKLSVDKTGENIGLILREEDVEIFVPDEYLETLKDLVASQDIPELENEKLMQFNNSLSSERIGSAVGRIIIESLGNASPEQKMVFKESLLGLMRDFLQNGDFRSLGNLFESLSGLQGEEGQANFSVRTQILKEFKGVDFAQNVLDSLYVWGKPKFTEIGSLIQQIGEPFAEPLLDRLAEEESITLRRYYLNQLIPMAGQAKNAILARLNDSRWYVLRNLVSILQHAGDSQVVKELEKIASFPHPKVRQKVIETFLLFKYSKGDRLLAQDLASAEQEVRLQAIQMAEKCNSNEITIGLLDIVRNRNLSTSAVREKIAVIRVLAKIGDNRALPVFDAQLKSRRFFRAASQRTINREIVATLGAYHDPLAIALLEKMKKSSDAGMASLAAEIYASLARDDS
nr:HEAT repeat domain-containing protein [Alphaproteobacteria bacterium]